MTKLDRERLDRVRELFDRAREVPLEEREAWLAAACSGDEELLAEVASLLAELENGGATLEPGRSAAALRSWFDARRGALEVAPEPMPETFPGFRLLSRLGGGAQGSVYRAEQERPRRQVALKVLRLDTSDARSRGRFELEGELLARLNHPGIAKVHEAGTLETEHGRVPYFALEYVSGRDLLRYAEEHELDQAARVELLAQVADAVQHAHERGVVHRDLKPANVLVDEHGRPRVLDFGIARLTDEDVRRATLETRPGQILGTLRYMSPEQASGLPDEVDTRTDIYSLGVMLYELLAHKAPYRVEESSLPAALRTICEQEPDRMDRLEGASDGELEVVVRKALAKEKSERYASAAELADDLRRFLRHEPIHARPPSRLYVLRKLVRRNRAASVAAALFVVSLFGGLVTASVLYLRSERARRAESYRHYVANLTALAASLEDGRLRSAERLLEDCPPEHRGWEWHHFRLRTLLADRTVLAHQRMRSAVLSADGGTLVTGDWQGTVRTWDARTGEPLGSLVRPRNIRAEELAVDADGSSVLAAGPSYVDRLTPGAATREELHLDPPAESDGSRGVVLSADGSLGHIARMRAGLETWDLVRGRRLASHALASPAMAMVGDGGNRLWIACAEGLVLWDPSEGRESWQVPLTEGAPRTDVLSVSADGRVLVTGDHAGRLAVHDADSGALVRAWTAHEEAVTAVCVSTDGSERIAVVSGSWDGVLRVWDGRSGALRNTIAAHDGMVAALMVGDGGKVISAGYDGFLRWWDLEARAAKRFGPADPEQHGMVKAEPSADGRWLVSMEGGRPVVVRDARTGTLAWTGDGGLDFALLEASGEVVVGKDSILSFRDLATGEATRDLRLEGRVVMLWAADGGRMLLVRRDNGAKRNHSMWPTDLELYSTGDLERLGHWEDHAHGALAAGGGTLFVTDQIANTVDAIDPDSGATRVLIDGEPKLEPHGELPLIAFGAGDGALELWSTDEPRRLLTLEGHPDRVITDLAFHPDGSRLASVAQNDSSVRLWDVATGELLCILRLELEYGQDSALWTRGMRSVAFSADGSRLVVGGRDGSVWVFDTDLEQARGLWGASSWR